MNIVIVLLVLDLATSLPPAFGPKHSEPTTHKVRVQLGVYWERDLRGQAWVAHTLLVMLLGVASSYKRGDA